MRGMKAKIPRSINNATRMEVADNTGARIVEVISVLKY
ncbi:MAG: 50S ribosomal protein L14, partial [Candidatus Methanoperedens sp.]